jgi:hypothetical protein
MAEIPATDGEKLIGELGELVRLPGVVIFESISLVLLGNL